MAEACSREGSGLNGNNNNPNIENESPQMRRRVHLVALLAIIILYMVASIALAFLKFGSSWASMLGDELSLSLPETSKETATSAYPTIVPDRSTPLSNDANATASKLGGMHVCTCLSNDNPRNLTPKRLRWLHIPKTGTSFISTLWSYAASTSDRYIDLSINSYECNNWDNSSYSMYDFALMRRYP